MKNNKLSETLKKEREKLDSLVDEAIKKQAPISKKHDDMNQWEISRQSGAGGNSILQNEAIQKQSRKVDRLILRAEKKRGNGNL